MSGSISKIKDALLSASNEATDSPYWLVIDPRPAQELCQSAVITEEIPETDFITSTIAMSCIEGPFFSRKDAEDYLAARNYNYSSDAIVWCASGYWSQKYKNFCKEVFSEKGEK